MTACTDAWIAWDHHEGLDLRNEELEAVGVSEVMKKAFRAGWESAGGDQRLEVLDKLEEVINDCPCYERRDEDPCVVCVALNDVRTLLGDGDQVEVEERERARK